MKMKQIKLEVDIHGTEDWMIDHSITGERMVELLERFLINVEGIGFASVDIADERTYEV